ncbi:unnamed protein product [Sphagnum jensenii]|uniref:RRM domain-containing protein n=1 Tax=Sphagnum jensenii TaxID=128206 RepID=A0ABP0W9F5_9BRYO
MAGSDCSANPATLTAEQEARGEEEEEEEEEEEMALQSESEDYFDFMGCDRSVRNSASTISRSSIDDKNFVVPLAAGAAISKGGRREVENHTKESEQRSEKRKRMMSSERKRSPIRYMEGQDHHNRVKENSKESNRYMDSGRETKQQQLRSRVVENCTTGWRRNDEDVAKERQARGRAEFKDDELPNRVVENCTTCSSRRNSSGDVGKERYARGGGGGGRETKEVLESSRIVENCTSGSRRNDEVIQKEEAEQRSKVTEKLRNANGDESQGQADKPEVKKEDKAGEPPSRKRSRVSGEGAKPRKPKEELSSRSHSKISTKRDYIKGSDKSTHEPRMQGHERTASQSASGLPRKHRSPSHRKKSTRSKSPHRNGSGEPGEWEKIERERAAMPAFSDSRYRRFGGGTSGLGGYSPRRRRSEAAIKTPSPPPRSPERRKPRAWDLAPPGIDSSVVAAMAAAHAAQQAAAQQAAALVSVSPLVSVNALNSVSTTPGTAASVPLAGVPSMIPSMLQQVSPAVVAVTLTQATRPLRRLYVGNVPSTVSDGELLEFMNAAMLSVNANHLAGTKPCISCSVNVEKAYAFAEFITPEDATVALAFDGVTLHGTTLKIRRPKDFIPPANGGSEIAQPKIDLVSSVVADSPHKVFLGGISSSLTSDKVKEIVTAFGQLKAYHWEVDTRTRPPQSFAFLEYLDPVVTLRACAGLNGMRLGSTILTVVQATPDAGTKVASAETPFYGVPEQAKPLLQTATRILELRNLVTEEEILTMTEEDVKELMEDVRLECLRFGTVKSMHIIKPLTPDDPTAVISEYAQASQLLGNGSNLKEVINSTPISPVPDSSIVLDAAMEPAMHITNDLATGGPSFSLRNHLEEPNDQKNIEGNEGASAPVLLELTSRKCVEADEEEKKAPVMEDANRIKTEDMTVITIRTGEGDEKVPGKVEDVSSEVQDLPANIVLPESSSDVLLPVTTDISVGENLSKEERERTGVSDCGMFNMGRLYVEFSREETACQAAHTLHGRMYGNHKVVVCYFPVRLYQKKFRKGLVARTYEEKQALALAVQGHLTAHIKE